MEEFQRLQHDLHPTRLLHSTILDPLMGEEKPQTSASQENASAGSLTSEPAKVDASTATETVLNENSSRVEEKHQEQQKQIFELHAAEKKHQKAAESQQLPHGSNILLESIVQRASAYQRKKPIL
eukprot:Sdes_comp19701_c0_seq2m11621